MFLFHEYLSTFHANQYIFPPHNTFLEKCFKWWIMGKKCIGMQGRRDINYTVSSYIICYKYNFDPTKISNLLLEYIINTILTL